MISTDWARASRPLVLVFVAVAFFVTARFHANVDAQGGAYATGVLVLITSAACAVTIAAWSSRARWPFLLVALVFIYTTCMNIRERPEGLKISCIFIATIMFVSFISRATRSTELRITGVDLRNPIDEAARQRLYDAVVDNVVLVIRGQQFSAAQYQAAAQLFGELMEDQNRRYLVDGLPLAALGLVQSLETRDTASVAIAPRKNTQASHNRLRNSKMSSSRPRIGRTILPTKSTTVVINPRIQKVKVTKR